MTNTKLSSSVHDALKPWLKAIPVGKACRKRSFLGFPSLLPIPGAIALNLTLRRESERTK